MTQMTYKGGLSEPGDPPKPQAGCATEIQEGFPREWQRSAQCEVFEDTKEGTLGSGLGRLGWPFSRLLHEM